MKLTVEPGTYIVAVSGGVDSMVLLDMLAQQSGLKLVVAHFDHGIRSDSREDRQLVEKVAEKLGLPFLSERAELGLTVSEATAREARYGFLRRQLKEYKARAIITAHHQDDLVETVLFNLMRGTNRRGLAPLVNQPDILRPMLPYAKADILDYANQQQITWREDSTNQDLRYSRNHIRHLLVPKLTIEQRAKLLDLINKTTDLNSQTDNLLAMFIAPKLDREWFATLDTATAKEVMASWLRSHGVREYSRQTLERTVQQVQNLTTGKRVDVVLQYQIIIERQHLALTRIER